MRRLVRPLLAFCVLLTLFSVATCTIVSLAVAGFAEKSAQAANIPRPMFKDVKLTRVPDAPPLPTEWPVPEFPASNVKAGDAAALKLVDVQTPFQTATQKPGWGTRFNGITDGVQTGQKVVALTIDDGPSENTRALIGELDSFGDHATFFWVGARITDDAAATAISHGEELANHTWNHPNMTALNSAEASAEIGLASARIAQLTGKPPVWFRSPYNRLFAPELQQIRAHGLLYANYDVMSADWMDGMSESDVVGKVAGTLKPGGVILMHDSPGRPTKALHPVLQLLHDRGYSVVTLSELAQMGDPVESPLTLGTKGLDW